ASLDAELGRAPQDFSEHIVWRRDDDSRFRPHRRRYPEALRSILDSAERGETTIAGFADAIQVLKDDHRVAPQMDRLFGTATRATHVDAGGVLRSVIFALVADDGTVSYSDDAFNTRWDEISRALLASDLTRNTVAPIPGLASDSFPIVLDENLVLDELTDDEVDNCVSVGLLH